MVKLSIDRIKGIVSDFFTIQTSKIEGEGAHFSSELTTRIIIALKGYNILFVAIQIVLPLFLTIILYILIHFKTRMFQPLCS